MVKIKTAKMITQINTLQDVSTFTHFLYKKDVNLNPDNDLAEYVNVNTRKLVYDRNHVDLRNKLMNQCRCFPVCEGDVVDIYDEIQQIYLTDTALRKFIPLPAQINNNNPFV